MGGHSFALLLKRCVRKIRYKKQTKKVDKRLLILSVGLTLIGLVSIADASAPSAIRDFSDKFYFVKQQLIWATLGGFLLLFTMRIKYTFWEKVATYLFFLSVILLVLVFIPGFGVSLLGAKRWIVIGNFTFQPAEIVKFTTVLYLAKVADKNKGIYSYLFPLSLVAFLIMLQPDLGTTLVIVATGLLQIYIAGVSFIHLSGAVFLGGATVLALILTSEYRRDRLLTFLERTQDPLGKSYHIRQVLLALGVGGFFGVGLGQSRQKYLFLPETASDSIFAVIAEETGFLGASVIIFLFVYFIYRGIKIASHAPDRFSQVLAAGIVAWIGGQAFLNIGSMVAVVPLTGIPLPFLSYGGSSLVSVLMATGILLNISKYATKAKK